MSDLTKPDRYCDIGGDYTYDHNDQPVYQEPCSAPVTHRYRSAGMVERHWGYRCSAHARWLDPSICTIEALAGAR